MYLAPEDPQEVNESQGKSQGYSGAPPALPVGLASMEGQNPRRSSMPCNRKRERVQVQCSTVSQFDSINSKMLQCRGA